MAQYERNQRVFVYPFTRQPDGDEVVVGRVDTATYLALPPEAVELLDLLAAGYTVGDAQDAFAARHGEVPDMEDFLGLLETHRLAAAEDHGATLAMEAAAVAPTVGGAVQYHFTRIPTWLAQAIFGKVSLVSCALVVALGLAAIALDPSLFPTRSTMIFPRHSGLMLLTLASLSYVSIFLHEMAHVLAERSVGVPSRLGIGHRLWVVVIEADLTALWSVPRGQRYLPFLAGPIVDSVSGAVLVLLLAGEKHGLWAFAPTAYALIRAMTFVYLMAVSWQFFFFVRTDLYYVIAAHFSCKNLLRDAEAFLRNQLARLFPRVLCTDQSQIPF